MNETASRDSELNQRRKTVLEETEQPHPAQGQPREGETARLDKE